MNCQHKLIRLTKVANAYLMFLTEQIDYEDNYFSHTVVMRQKFIDHIWQTCQVKWKDSAVKSAFKQLIKQGLIISYGGRIEYTVNPIHFYKGPESERKKLIQSLISQARLTSGKSNIKMCLGL